MFFLIIAYVIGLIGFALALIMLVVKLLQSWWEVLGLK